MLDIIRIINFHQKHSPAFVQMARTNAMLEAIMTGYMGFE